MRVALLFILCAVVVPVFAASPLADAAMKGDKAAVQKLLQQKTDVNSTQADGSSALHWAVYRGDLEMADALQIMPPDGTDGLSRAQARRLTVGDGKRRDVVQRGRHRQ